eukprot:TRINITY_DN111389_c0_g1_i1.p1 TRINITY_DN111389_c0_g1~~TRINITY_DN111389_c0_g1_i1.p1  ORF type:complete len:755 (-),score=315.21 TRINITY_DN111389_c0_g1_i1:179-2443(-)
MAPLSTNVSRREILQKCIQVIDTYEPKKTTVDAYMQDTPVLKDKRLGDLEQKFIHQVFYGAVRYQKFLKLFVTSFLYKCPTTALRSEQTLYSVLAYILFFRLEELSVAEFQQLLRESPGSEQALLALLQYALSVDELERWVKVEWCKLYDCHYIETQVIGKLQTFADELRPVVEEVELKATGTIASSDTQIVKTRKATEMKPFNLTKVKPRLIPEPEVISRQIKAMPVPNTIHKTSLEEVEAQKKQRMEEERAKVRDKYAVTEAPPLTTATRVDPSEREELAKRVEAERMAECTFQPAAAKKYVPPTEEAVVRHNAAAVLREDALLKKKQAKEYELLKRYEEDLHDASGFHKWQQEQREKDELEEEARMRQRMVEMQLAREEAIEAFESCVRKKHIMAEHQKEEAKVAQAQKAYENELELEEKRHLVTDVQEDRERARVAEQEILRVREQNAERLRKEKEDDFARKRREEEFELEKKKDLIRQIRALEKVPVERFKAFDPAEPPAHGLMEEMSLSELRERLETLKSQRQRELEDKRERQLEKKAEKQMELAEKAETLAQIREVAREQAKERHAERKRKQQEVEEKKQQYLAKCVEEASEKIAAKKKEKRQEELRLKKELKDIAVKAQFLQANAEMVEVRGHHEQHKGLEREAGDRQRRCLSEQRKRNSITNKETDIRVVNRERDVTSYKAMQAHVTERMERAKSNMQTMKEEIKKANLSARNIQRATEARGKAEFGHSSNKYMHKVEARMCTSA